MSFPRFALPLSRIIVIPAFLTIITSTLSAVQVDYGWMKGSTTIQSNVPGTINVSAAANSPGTRMAPAMWKDKTRGVWLFGGMGLYTGGAMGYLNDLWYFDSATGDWTWKSGNPDAAGAAVYGVQGVAATGNTPGARVYPATWTGNDGRLHLFGGASPGGFYNDLWCLIQQTVFGLGCAEAQQ